MNVFIVEDEPMIIDVLKAYLEKENYQVNYATNGADGLFQIKEQKPDFILLDLMLPDISGEEICREIRSETDIPIMMITAKSAENDRINGIEIGADDYIVKPFSPREVVARIKGILRRVNLPNFQTSCCSFNNGQLIVDAEQNKVIANNKEIALTPIEYKLLVYMVKNPGRAFSRSDLLIEIQEDGYFEGYERGIDVHIKNLRKKIEEDSRAPKYILTVFGVGYRFGGKSDV